MTNLNENQPTLDDQFTDPVINRLIQTRKTLVQNDATAFYLGDPARNFKYKVTWKRVGHGNKLVTKNSATAVDDIGKTEASTATPTTTSTLLEPAVFSAIIFIDFDDCWLTPCGFWKGPTTVTKKFEDLKLSIHGVAPPTDFLAEDFSNLIENAKSLMDDIKTGGAKPTGFLVTTKNGNTAIRLRHVVFEVYYSFYPLSIFLYPHTENQLNVRRKFRNSIKHRISR
jgi:hypothetical protein